MTARLRRVDPEPVAPAVFEALDREAEDARTDALWLLVRNGLATPAEVAEYRVRRHRYIRYRSAMPVPENTEGSP